MIPDVARWCLWSGGGDTVVPTWWGWWDGVDDTMVMAW